jgi:uncharacterized protein (TIGR02145 family)
LIDKYCEIYNFYIDLLKYHRNKFMRTASFFSIVILSFLLAISCKKQPTPTPTPIDLPVVTTSDLSSIAQVTAISGGKISSQGGASVTDRGVCWSSLHTPTIKDSLTNDGNGRGIFTSYLFNLRLNHTYRIRAYATNSGGTAYGNEISFTTLNAVAINFNPYSNYGTLTDIDGNTYKTIKIGTQLWMAENLKTTRYRNGDLIGTTIPVNKDMYHEDLPPEYQWSFEGTESNVSLYGRLYTWHTVDDSRKICPANWHVPSDTEWNVLISYSGGLSVAADKLKERGTSHWLSPNTGATNQSGFTALPGGIRTMDGEFKFNQLVAQYWSSTALISNSVSWNVYMDNLGPQILMRTDPQRYGYSVRCISDN